MLRINGLKKEYKNFSLDCSLEVKAGSIVGLVGANGSGKSTVFKSALGLVSADGGDITLFGKDIRSITPKDREAIGAVLSDSGFSGYFRLRDIIPIMKNMYKEFDLPFFKEQAERFGLPFDKKIKELSMGMRAKLKCLAAVSHNARLLILDEPTSGLDVVARDEVMTILREYMEKDSTRAILISSHISSDLEALCDDIYMIHRGRIVLHEDTDLLLSDYALLKVDGDGFEGLDKSYILYKSVEPYGYCCLTDQRSFYAENYPRLVMERGTIDGIITMIIKGERL